MTLLNWARCAVPLAALALMPSAWAFRCNSNVIDAGMQKIEVLKKCGTPTTQDTRVERRALRVRDSLPRDGFPRGSVEEVREIEIQIDEWVYNFGPSQFMQHLLFENGRLVQVKDLGYGS
jgi:hypothetical protein